MNMKNIMLAMVLSAASLVAVAADDKPSAAAEKSAPKRAVAIPEKNEVQPAEGEDTLNLNDVDDSADAASAPKVTQSKKQPVPAPLKPDAVAAPAAVEKQNKSVEGLFATDLANDESALVDITCDSATLEDIIRQFRRTTGANIITGDSSNLQQRVSATLNAVPWKDALKAILKMKNFRLEQQGDIYNVNEDPQTVPEFTRSYVLNHASAVEMARLFNTVFGGMHYNETTGLPLAPAAGQKPGRQIATAFQGANVVVVTATESILDQCKDIIKSTDKLIPQIYIEARFIEVSNESMHKLGTQWNSLESWGATVKGLSGGLEYNNGGRQPWAATPGAATGAGRGNGSEGGIAGNIADWHTARGFSGQLSADDFRLAISAFEKMEDAKIFSNPKIIVSNGKEAKVDMTTKFPNVRIQATRNSSNGSDSLDISTQLEVIPGEDKLLFAKEAFFSWGITLSVKPRISPDGLISVEIVPQISQLDKSVMMDPEQVPTGFVQVKGGDSSAMSYYPVIQVKRLTTDFTMKDGATAVIGGLSKTEEEDVDSGIPYLRDIPYVGKWLFGWKSRGMVQKEIIVFVTLGIADPADLPADVGLPKNAVTGRDYVEGRKFEPGDRDGGAVGLMTLDKRPIEEIRADNQAKPGSVVITPVRKQLPKNETK